MLPVDPVLPVEPEPMFGQGCFPVGPPFGAPDFCGGGVVGVVVVGVGDGVVVVVAALLEALGAAAAPVMPATAPVVASAPATIVALSILDMVIAVNLRGSN